LGNPRVVPAAKAIYETGDHSGRVEAMGALLRLGTREAEVTFHDLLEKEQSRVAAGRRRERRGASASNVLAAKDGASESLAPDQG
jgi:hypothetical protein